MEFNFEEKFILGHQDFLNCCLKLQFGVGSKSICVLVDRSGALYFPIVSDNGDVTIHNVDLRDIRRKNLRITSAYHIEHDGRSYLFVACDAKEGGGYSLITYCTSNYDILKKEKDLVSWQILEIPFKIMDARSLTDDNHNSILLLCGSDKRVHLYLLDAQCIIFKKKKSNLYRNLMVDRFLLLEDKDNECLGTALPIRLFINQNRNVNPCVPDILLGYSNGITIWYHETIFLQNNSNEFDFIQEIPLFQGISNNLNSTTSLESGMSMSRKSRSADDLLKVLEHVVENNSINEDTEIRGKTTDYLNNLDVSLPLASIVEEDSEEESTSGLPSKFPEIVPKMTNIEVSQIERKILFFDGISSCSCFYNIPIPITSQNDNMNKNRSISRLNLQTKVQLFIPCVVIGLASGSTLLVQYDDVENPIPILSKSFQHGAVLALAQEFISNNICKDIDGTIILVKYESNAKQNSISNNAEKIVSNGHFKVLWKTQLSFPIIGISYGHHLLCFRDEIESISNINNKLGDDYKNINHSNNNDNNGNRIFSDQLAIVTSNSFHLYLLSFANSINTDQIDSVDQLLEKFSSYLF